MYDTRTGSAAGLGDGDGTDSVCSPGLRERESLEFVRLLCFSDLSEEEELPWGELEAIAGMVSSTSQLHFNTLDEQSFPLEAKTYAEEFSEGGIVRFAGLALDVFQVLGEPEAQDLEHATEVVVCIANGDEGTGLVEIVPVLEVGRRFEELRGKGETNRRHVGDANETGQREVSGEEEEEVGEVLPQDAKEHLEFRGIIRGIEGVCHGGGGGGGGGERRGGGRKKYRSEENGEAIMAGTT